MTVFYLKNCQMRSTNVTKITTFLSLILNILSDNVENEKTIFLNYTPEVNASFSPFRSCHQKLRVDDYIHFQDATGNFSNVLDLS